MSCLSQRDNVPKPGVAPCRSGSEGRRYPRTRTLFEPTPKGLRPLSPNPETSCRSRFRRFTCTSFFSTKDRVPFLGKPELRAEMHSYLGGASRQIGCPAVLVGGVEDHVHILARIGRTITQADWVKDIKRASSIWIKEREPALRDFAWQAGYGIFSVSVSNLESARDYIASQEEHHRRMTFQDEYRALLRKHGSEWDERFVWE